VLTQWNNNPGVDMCLLCPWSKWFFSVLALSVADRRLGASVCSNQNNIICTYCFSSQHTASKSNSNDWSYGIRPPRRCFNDEINSLRNIVCKWVGDCCLTPSVNILSYVMARTNHTLMRWWWYQLFLHTMFRKELISSLKHLLGGRIPYDVLTVCCISFHLELSPLMLY
jgi:hypothetical protein